MSNWWGNADIEFVVVCKVIFMSNPTTIKLGWVGGFENRKLKTTSQAVCDWWARDGCYKIFSIFNSFEFISQ